MKVVFPSVKCSSSCFKPFLPHSSGTSSISKLLYYSVLLFHVLQAFDVKICIFNTKEHTKKTFGEKKKKRQVEILLVKNV